MGSGNLKGRLEKLEAKRSSGRVTWRLEDGREVSFSSFEMLKARYDLFRRVYEAWCGEELPPLDGVWRLSSTPQRRNARGWRIASRGLLGSATKWTA